MWWNEAISKFCNEVSEYNAEPQSNLKIVYEMLMRACAAWETLIN